MDITTLLPSWMRSEDILAMIAGVAAFASFLMIWNALLVKDNLPDRIKNLNKRRNKLRGEMVSETRQRSQLISRENFMHSIVKKLQLMKGEKADRKSVV